MRGEWKVIDWYQAVENEAHMRRAAEAAKQKQRDLKRMLDEQVGLKKSKSSPNLKEEEAAYARTQAKLLAEWREDVEARRHAASRKHLEEKAARDAQLEGRRAVEAREREVRLAFEARELAACRRDMEKEREAAARRKMEARERLRDIQRETAEERAASARRERRESLEDQRMMAEFKAKLDREEEARQKAFAVRMKRLEHFTASSGENGAGYEERQNVRREEARILVEQKKKEAADLERERRDMEAIREKHRAITMENRRLVEEKKNKERKEIEEERRFAKRYVRESQDYLRSEADRLVANRQAMLRHQKCLEAQIKERRDAAAATLDMDPRERSLNKALLEKIKSTPEMSRLLPHSKSNALTEGAF